MLFAENKCRYFLKGNNQMKYSKKKTKVWAIVLAAILLAAAIAGPVINIILH